MSDTPRTDKEWFLDVESEDRLVEVEFAEGLERELSAMTAERDALRADVERRNELLRAARNYYTRYCQDEAEDVTGEDTGCGVQQHNDAVQLRDAITAIDNAMQGEVTK